MRRWPRQLGIVLANGLILFFYSERVFWSFPRAGRFLDVADTADSHRGVRGIGWTGWTIPSQWVLYVIATPLGFVWFGRSLWALPRTPPRRGGTETASTSSPPRSAIP